MKRQVYLIHFDQPFRHARHYMGSTDDLAARTARHYNGRGSRLIQRVTEAGIPWKVVRTWAGDRQTEKLLKKQKNSRMLCPVCNPTNWMYYCNAPHLKGD